MKPLDRPEWVLWRVRSLERKMAGGGGYSDDKFGIFFMPLGAVTAQVIASNGDGWDHISVSIKDSHGRDVGRCPIWEEMEEVKRIFFEPHETAMQLHVPPSDHISRHPWVLHLWRPHKVKIPRPPSFMV